MTCLTMLACTGPAFGGPVEARSDLGDQVATPPGRVLTVSWVLSNASDQPKTVREQVSLPENWELINAERTPATIPSHGSILKLAAIRVPLQAAVGIQRISCAWYDTAPGAPAASLATLAFNVSVLPRRKLDLVAQSSPELAIGGETYAVRLLATNRGNETIRLHATAAIAPASLLVVTPADFMLEPGATHELKVIVTTAANWPRRQVATLQVNLTPDRGPAADCTILTDVIPATPHDAASHMPLRLESTLVREPDGNLQWRLEASGSTTLDEAGTRRLSYVFRGPDTKDTPLFLEPGQFSMNYTAPTLTWQAGDQIYALSPLTARGQLARGFGVESDPAGPWKTGAFASVARYHDEDASLVGGFVAYQADANLTFQFNALGKSIGPLESYAGGHAAVTSLQATYDLSQQFHAESEIGYDPYRPATAKSGQPFAGRLTLNGKKPDGLVYRANFESYGAAYFGSLRDAMTGDLSVESPIAGQLAGRVEAHYNQYTDPHNLPFETLLSNRESAESAGLIWRNLGGVDYSLDLQRANRSFAFTAAATEYREQTVQLGVGKSFGKFGIRAYANEGRLHEIKPATREAAITRFNATAFWQPTSTTNCSLYVSGGNDAYSPVASSTRTIGASLSTSLGSRVTISAQGGENLYDARIARRRSYLFSKIALALPDRQSISLRTGWFQRESSAGGGLTVALSYSRTFDLPKPMPGRRAEVTGQVFDAALHTPLRRVVLVLGDATAVTDSHGRFRFTGLKAGHYLLKVDSRTLGEDRLPVEKLPLSIELARNEAKQVDLPVVVTGTVQVMVAAVESPGSPSAHVDAVLVELKGNGQTLRQLTDVHGRAVFPHVLPGAWAVQVDASSLPAHYKLSQDQLVVQVAPARTQSLNLALNYQAPTVRWLTSDN